MPSAGDDQFLLINVCGPLRRISINCCAFVSSISEDWSTLARYIPRALGKRSPALCALMLRLLEVVERLAWHQLNHIKSLDKATAAQWEIFPCVLKCIVDEVVVVCRHRKTATEAAKKAMVELATDRASAAGQTESRSLSRRTIKAPKFEPKAIVSISKSSSIDFGTQTHAAKSELADTRQTSESVNRAVSRATNTSKQTKSRQTAIAQANLPCPACVRRRSVTRRPSRSVGTSSVLATRSVGIVAVATVQERETTTPPGPNMYSAAMQTEESKEREEEDVSRLHSCLATEDDTRLCAEEKPTTRFTLQYSVNSALQRVYTTALENRTLTPDTVGVAEIQETPENSTEFANSASSTVRAPEGSLQQMDGKLEEPDESISSKKQECYLSEGGAKGSHLQLEDNDSYLDRGRDMSETIPPREGAGEEILEGESEEFKSNQTNVVEKAKDDAPVSPSVGTLPEDTESKVVPVGSRRRRSSHLEAHSVRLTDPPLPTMRPAQTDQASDASSWHEGVDDAEGMDEESMEKYAKMVTSWVSGLWGDSPAARRRRSYQRKVSAQATRYKPRDEEPSNPTVTHVTSAVSRYLASVKEQRSESSAMGAYIQEPIVLPNSVSSLHRKRSVHMPLMTPSLFYSASRLPDQMGPSEVRDWEELSQYIPQVLSPISPPLCTLILRILVIANKLAEHQLSYIDQMGSDTAAQWDIFPNVIKCIVDEIALLGKRESQRPCAKTRAISVQTSESKLRTSTTTKAVQSESVSISQPATPAPRDKTSPIARDSSLDLNLPRLMKFKRDGLGVAMGESPVGTSSRTDRRTQTLVWGDAAYDSAMPSPPRRNPTRKVSVQTDEIGRVNVAVSCTILDGLDAPAVPPAWFVEAMGEDLQADDGALSAGADIDELSQRISIADETDDDYEDEDIGAIPLNKVTERSVAQVNQSEDGDQKQLPASPDNTETLGFVEKPSPEFKEEDNSPRESIHERKHSSVTEELDPIGQPQRQISSISEPNITAEDGVGESETYLDTATTWFNSLWAPEGSEMSTERRPSTSTIKSESRSSYRVPRRPSQQQGSPDVGPAPQVEYVPLPSSPIRRRRNRQ